MTPTNYGYQQYPSQGMYAAPQSGMTNAPGYAPVMTTPPITGNIPSGTPTYPSTGTNPPVYTNGNTGGNTGETPGTISNPFQTGSGTTTHPVPQYDEPMNGTSYRPGMAPGLYPVPTTMAPTPEMAYSTQLPNAKIAQQPVDTNQMTVIRQANNQSNNMQTSPLIESPQVPESELMRGVDPQTKENFLNPVPAENTQEENPFGMPGSSPQSSLKRPSPQTLTQNHVQQVNATIVRDTTKSPYLAYDGDKLRWIRGVLNFDPATRTYSVTYSNAPDEKDPYHGTIKLANDQRLSQLKNQDLVQIEGTVRPTSNMGPYYQIVSIQKLDPTYQ
jgi:hypothetical protein